MVNLLFFLQQILSLLHVPIGKRTTVVLTPHDIPSGSLLPHLRLTESRIVQNVATEAAGRVRGGTGKNSSLDV